MEVHHHHGPIRNWREFTKEVGIIVLGVLIALGGEQAVEAILHHNEVQEARHALNAELADDIGRWDQMQDRQTCTQSRLDEINRWRQSWEDGHPLRLLHPIPNATVPTMSTSIWGTTADAVSRMPLKERSTYAKLYTAIENQLRIESRMLENWRDLARYGFLRRLSDDQRSHIAADISGIRELNAIQNANYKVATPEWQSLGITPAQAPPEAQPIIKKAHATICQPLLAK